MMTRNILSFLLAIGALQLFVANSMDQSFAWQCTGPRSPRESLGLEDAVFVGKVIDIDQSLSGDEKKVLFHVERTWKGVAQGSVILTQRHLPDYEFRVDEKYLVYAFRQEGVLGSLSASVCSRTAPIEYAQEDLKALGSGTMIADESFLMSVAVAALVVGTVSVSLLLAKTTSLLRLKQS